LGKKNQPQVRWTFQGAHPTEGGPSPVSGGRQVRGPAGRAGGGFSPKGGARWRGRRWRALVRFFYGEAPRWARGGGAGRGVGDSRGGDPQGNKRGPGPRRIADFRPRWFLTGFFPPGDNKGGRTKKGGPTWGGAAVSCFGGPSRGGGGGEEEDGGRGGATGKNHCLQGAGPGGGRIQFGRILGFVGLPGGRIASRKGLARAGFGFCCFHFIGNAFRWENRKVCPANFGLAQGGELGRVYGLSARTRKVEKIKRERRWDQR